MFNVKAAKALGPQALPQMGISGEGVADLLAPAKGSKLASCPTKPLLQQQKAGASVGFHFLKCAGLVSLRCLGGVCSIKSLEQHEMGRGRL